MTTATRRSDPSTSADAERAFTDSGARQSHCARVLAAVRAPPGSTGHELGAAVWPENPSMGEVRALRRLNDLRKDGLVRQGPARRGPSGRPETTWYPATMQGRLM